MLTHKSHDAGTLYLNHSNPTNKPMKPNPETFTPRMPVNGNAVWNSDVRVHKIVQELWFSTLWPLGRGSDSSNNHDLTIWRWGGDPSLSNQPFSHGNHQLTCLEEAGTSLDMRNSIAPQTGNSIWSQSLRFHSYIILGGFLHQESALSTGSFTEKPCSLDLVPGGQTESQKWGSTTSLKGTWKM